MTGPPRRWPDDSPAEDFEARRATDTARLNQWAREQKTRPLTDALETHGVERGGSPESWAGPLILPDWWDDIPEPDVLCPWCQRQVPAWPCPECRAARAQDDDPASMRAWWEGLTPAQRRLNIASRYGTDPWSGRPAAISIEWTSTDDDGRISTARMRYLGCAPASIYWSGRGQPS